MVTTLSQAEVRAVIVGVLLALFLAALDQTIVATALPTIASDLGGLALISWVVTAYLLSSVCAMPVAGKLSDIYGRRPVLLACLVLFLAGSVFCALAPDMLSLIVARAIQGAGGGGLITMAQATVADVVPPRERGRYGAYFSAVWAASGLLGPALGGVLAEHAGWRWIFWINLPIGLVALLMSDRALRRLVGTRRPARIDFPGILAFTAGTTALLLFVSLGGHRFAWIGSESAALLTAAAILLALFVRRQRATSEPILPPHVLRHPVVGPVLGSAFLISGAFLTLAVLTPLYFQAALGVGVSASGLYAMPVMVSTTITAALAGHYNRISGQYRLPPLIGLPIGAAALVALAATAPHLSAPAASALLMVAGLGVGPIFPCSIVAAQNAVGRGEIGTVSGALSFSRSLGGAIGAAAGTALVVALAHGALVIGQDTEGVAAAGDANMSVAVQAFRVLFGALAATLLLGMAVFARVEERTLKGAI